MTARTERRLNLLDVVVFVAMAGAVIVSLPELAFDGFALSAIRHGLVSPLLPCGLAWTLAVLVLRLRSRWHGGPHHGSCFNWLTLTRTGELRSSSPERRV